MTNARIWSIRGAIGGAALSLLAGVIGLAIAGELGQLDYAAGYLAGSMCGGLLGAMIGDKIGSAIDRKNSN